jgi:acetolactate synthase I/II/III large subunit
VNSINKKLASECIIDYLINKGVSKSFGIVGGAIESITNAIAQSTIEDHYPAHENTCTYAASKVYEYSNKPALVFTTTGPGILNLVNGTATSYMERQPFFIVAPHEKQSSHDKGAFQTSRRGGVDTLSIFSDITCYCDEISSVEHLEQKLNLAWFNMIEHQRPVVLFVPIDILTSMSEPVKVFDDMSHCISGVLESISKNDCIVIGERSKDILFNLVELSRVKGIPILDTPASRGFIHGGVSNYKGMVGMAGNNTAFDTIEKSDNVYYFNGELTEYNIGDNTSVLNKTTVISNRASDLYRGRTKKYHISDRVVNSELSNILGGKTTSFHENNKQNPPPKRQKEITINTEIIMDYLSSISPVDTQVFFDTGNSFLFGLNRWNVKKSKNNARKTVNVSFKQSSMACAIPSVIGACYAQPDLSYLVVMGDGSFSMGSNEFKMLNKLNTNIVIVVLNDSVMGMAMHGQRLSGAEVRGIDNGRIDIAKIAEASGVLAYSVTNMTQFEKIDLTQKRCVLIDILIDRDTVPPIFQRLASLNK